MFFSIGHSNHDIQRFVDLLKDHEIAMVVDVRSSPYSQYSPQYNQPILRNALRAIQIEYHFLGTELGGRPQEDWFYDNDGHVLYDRLAQSDLFLHGLHEVEQFGKANRIAMMCSEENPAVCHRFLLISRVLEAAGATVSHIRGSGLLQSSADVLKEAARSGGDADQLVLFDAEPDLPWKSIQSVSRKKPLRDSSEFSGVRAFKD